MKIRISLLLTFLLFSLSVFAQQDYNKDQYNAPPRYHDDKDQYNAPPRYHDNKGQYNAPPRVRDGRDSQRVRVPRLPRDGRNAQRVRVRRERDSSRKRRFRDAQSVNVRRRRSGPRYLCRTGDGGPCGGESNHPDFRKQDHRP